MTLLVILGLCGAIVTQSTRSRSYVPSIQTMRDASWYASAVACTDQHVLNWSCKMCQKVPTARHVESFANKIHNTRAFVAIDSEKSRVIVAFRGSKNIQNVMADGLFVLTSYSPASRINSKVHSGFKLATLSVYDAMRDRVRLLLKNPEYSRYKILMTGHSLGGAMAVLSTIKLREDLQLSWNRFQVITFGQPPHWQLGICRVVQ
ncbi:hypothetical protein DSO57_1027914 [Entomophthora muscae]|uniref:Uncharacterized protein n=1 Tax=Entomophthora muscae TaxID=34485 RepID=A0ACC2S425_9FUNG|nr:hypothetical protein DSO57_1027914 [Entomophthora muscae]